MNVLNTYKILHKAATVQNKVLDMNNKIIKLKQEIRNNAGDAVFKSMQYPEYEQKLIKYYCDNPLELARVDCILSMGLKNVNEVNMNDNIYIGYCGYDDAKIDLLYESQFSLFKNQSNDFYDKVIAMANYMFAETSFHDYVTTFIPISFGSKASLIEVTHCSATLHYYSYNFCEDYYISYQYIKSIKYVLELLTKNQDKLIEAINKDYEKNKDDYEDN